MSKYDNIVVSEKDVLPEVNFEGYEFLQEYVQVVELPARPLLGRGGEIRSVLSALARAEVSNAILLAPAGAGKSALVQGITVIDKNRIYLEVDLSKMAASENGEDGAIQMASRLKGLFDDAIRYRKSMEEEGNTRELVFFIDEFHQIVQLSQAATEAIKPILARSGTLGIKIIAATTFDEFVKYVSSNQALVERLQRINLSETPKDIVLEILKSTAKRYGLADDIRDDNLYNLIYEYSNRYIPANAQPRKSILILDAMIGWVRSFPDDVRMDKQLLADVIYESAGVNVNFNVDAREIQRKLNRRVMSQKFAVASLEKRLQVAVADLQDKSRPMSSFLFTGSTGVGKPIYDGELVPTVDGFKKHGELCVGDKIFNRKGEVVEITAFIPKGHLDAYLVEFADGREIICAGDHLWTVRGRKAKSLLHTYSVEEMLEMGINSVKADGSQGSMKFYIPMNEAVEREEKELDVHPYVLGSFLGDGCCTEGQLSFSSSDEESVAKIAELLGAKSYKQTKNSYTWHFERTESVGRSTLIQTHEVFGNLPEIDGALSVDKRIPDAYKFASIKQRWELVQGLFDTDGTIVNDGFRFNVSFYNKSKDLCEDLQEVLYSLGVSSTISSFYREREGVQHNYPEYRLAVKSSNEDKDRFFSLSRKVATANLAKRVVKQRQKSYDRVGIKQITKLDEKLPMSCIMVDDSEHLYQVGKQYIVTHNTEMAKGLAELLFHDEKQLIRFDMSEYGLETSLDHFREELSSKVWQKPFSIILFDEIEKAHQTITRLLLQVLDDGRLSDRNNREVSFVNSYIIITTNAGSEIFKTIKKYSEDKEGTTGMAGYEQVIRASLINNDNFAPEILGRIDSIIPFQPLVDETLMKIVKNKLLKFIKEVKARHGVTLRIGGTVTDYLIYENADRSTDAGGARGIIRKMNIEVVAPVSRFINQNPDIKRVGVIVVGDMVKGDKTKRIGTAKIVVGDDTGA